MSQTIVLPPESRLPRLPCVVSDRAPVRKLRKPDKGPPPFSKVLKEGGNPPLDAYDNFVIAVPSIRRRPEREVAKGVPRKGSASIRPLTRRNKTPEFPALPPSASSEMSIKEPEDADRPIKTHDKSTTSAKDHGVYVPAQYKAKTESGRCHGGPRTERPHGKPNMEPCPCRTSL